MQKKYIQTSQISLALLLSTLLVACGGGSSTNNVADEPEDEVTVPDDNTNMDPIVIVGGGTGTVNTPGTGACVSIVTPKVGDTSVIQNVTIFEGTSAETDVRTSYTAVSNTSWSYDSEVVSNLDDLVGIEGLIPNDLLPDGIDLSDSLALTSQTTETFTIANNFINITKSETTSASLGLITTTYSPPRSAPTNEVCEGQVFTQNYTETIVSLGGTDIEEVNITNTIEAVNVQKSAPAGTFNTFQVKSEAAEATLTTWVDIASSTIVIMEFRNAAGDLLGTSSLISQ